MLIFFNPKKLNKNYSLLKLNKLFLDSKFIIFFYLINITSTKLYEIKNELLLLNIVSIIVNNKFLKILVKLPDFNMFAGTTLNIFINNIDDFTKVSSILGKIEFFYLFENSLSNFTNSKILSEELFKLNNINIKSIILNRIFKIILFLIFFNFSFIKFIK